ncbi:MAG: energy-coupling factor ABC transporter ATP-binding protein [Oscillospiraceae bacterium]|nr:energy-coupling factor ABC transporter ATP-binding protein [Oscillospiraceae bacterium]
MLTLREVTVIYPDKTKAVDNLSFTLGENENIALIGENGAGKTSLLLAIVGILEPSGGAIEVNGVRLEKKNLNEIRRQVGLVFQNPDDQLFMPLIYDDVAFGCRNCGLSEDETQSRVETTLERLGIGYLGKRSSLKLSGGEKRMAAIAAVLAMDPAVLIFDEPTAYLDPKAKRSLAETLKGLQHPKLIATHDMAFAAEVCNRLIILKNGRLMADGDLSLLNDEKFMRNCGL